MKSERILYALGGVNPSFVEEASPERRTLPESSRLRRAAVRWGAAIACATALALCAVFVDWRELLWPRPVTPSAERPSASTSSGTTAAVMLTLEIRIDAWRADGFEGTVVKPVVYPADTPFTGGQTVFVCFRPNGTTVEWAGERFSYGSDSGNAADCGLAVGTVAWVDYQSYEETPDAEQDYTVRASLIWQPQDPPDAVSGDAP